MQAQPAWETTLLDWATSALDTSIEAHHASGDADALSLAYAACDRLTAMHSRTFYMASGLLPAPKRKAVRALYAFCRVTDDTVDAADGSADERRVALATWGEQSLQPHPAPSAAINAMVAVAWADARARYGVPVGYAHQLIEGVGRDLVQPRYKSFDELAAYSYGVASTVGLMAMHIIGFAGSAALPYAVRLGVALQMTNILRDVGEDWRNGRLYLPADELAEFRLSEADVARMAEIGSVDDRWRAFMRFQIARNRELYADGTPGIRLLNRDGRFAIGAAADLYRAILRDIEAHDYNVFTRRASVSTAGKLRRLPGIWWRAAI
jgi:15-cis-phytoene synthase